MRGRTQRQAPAPYLDAGNAASFWGTEFTPNGGTLRAACHATWFWIDWPTLYPANRFMAPAWRWLRPDGAANSVSQTARSAGLVPSMGLPDGAEALHPKTGDGADRR